MFTSDKSALKSGAKKTTAKKTAAPASAKRAPAKKSAAKKVSDVETVGQGAEVGTRELSDAKTPSEGAAIASERALKKVVAEGGGPSVAEAQASHGRAGPSRAQMRKELFRRENLNDDGTPKRDLPPAPVGTT